MISSIFNRKITSLSMRKLSSIAKDPLVTIEILEDRRVAILTLNAPKKLNALSEQMGDDLLKAMPKDWSNINALVITGSGKAFSAGGDLDFLRARSKDTPGNNTEVMKEFYGRFLGQILQCPVPTIAAINGAAIGAGFAFTLGCDMRITTKSAKLGLTFVGLGLHPGMGSSFLLPYLIGHENASRMLLTGCLIDGTEALTMRLVTKCTDTPEDVLPAAIELATLIAKQAPLATKQCTRTLRISKTAGLDAALWREASW